LLRAHTTKALNLHSSRRYDRRYRLAEELVFEQLEADNLVTLQQTRHLQHSAAAAVGGEAYKEHFNRAVEEHIGIGRTLFPWVAWDAANGPADADYVQMWEDYFGVKVGSDAWKKLEADGHKLREMYTGGRAARYRWDTGAEQH